MSEQKSFGSYLTDDNLLFIENEYICIGANLSLGGALTYLAEKGKKNLINSYDWGRQVQMSFYNHPIPYIPEGVAVFKGAENAEAAKYFVEWLYSNDENLAMLAEIDQKTAVKVIKPSMEGVELAYSTDMLVDVDVALFGSQREDILAKFEVLMGDKAVAE